VADTISRLAVEADTTLAEQLGRWGYYEQQLQLCDRLLNASESISDADSAFYQLVGAQAHYGLSRRRGEGSALGNLGLVYEAQRNYAGAIAGATWDRY